MTGASRLPPPPAPHSQGRGGRRWWKGTSDGRLREPFPLPLLCCTADGDQLPKSRASLKRLSRRLATNSRLNEVISALNVLNAGGPGRAGKVGSMSSEPLRDIAAAPRQAQRMILRDLLQVVERDRPASPPPEPEAALRELLKERAAQYSSFCRGAVAAPAFAIVGSQV